ncbi:hypothetical protein SAMN04487949_0343 [Halogranum gelatinilyticum]|uniref:Uncharacterized protein n=1 Tax=Halogranum gelatinilyticum TaxID=660521 RepID=A0A1G9PE53_9EURY|nr:hypothetical protein [Halogranum gelatinilyticum]SDL96823.1 hypothetical protein SAMN04487949_0343 [Halogranum gelatinilyticum]
MRRADESRRRVEGVEGVDLRDEDVDLRDEDVAPDTVLAAVRGERERPPSLRHGRLSGFEHTETPETPDAPPIPEIPASHDVLGHVDGDLQPSLRVWLAAAARSVGREPPQRAAYDDVRAALDDLVVPDVDVAAARRRVAEAGAEEARLREELATLRGRLQARRETDAPTEGVAAELAETATRLSEVETERVAAEQTLDRREAAAREAREKREQQLELEDRAANLRRAMRESLAAAVAPAFADAVASVAAVDCLSVAVETPPPTEGIADPGAYDGPDALAQLAAVRVADLDTPVVVSAAVADDADSVTDDADSAADDSVADAIAEVLGTPVVLL